MPRKIQKSLKSYLSKIKNPAQQIHIPFSSVVSSKNWVLSGCRHAKTTSCTIEGTNEAHGSKGNGAATLSDVDRFLYENFRSLYLRDDEDGSFRNAKGISDDKHGEAPKLGSILFDSPQFMNPPSDICGSNRFFFKPSFSGSLLDDPLTSMTSTGDDASSSSTLNDSFSDSHHHLQAKQAMDGDTLPNDCIAVLTHSPSPYEDFRRSMRDVVETRSRNHESVDWEFMEELLFCYLNLNDRKSHKFILNAFVDLMVVLRKNWGDHADPAKPRSVRSVRLAKR